MSSREPNNNELKERFSIFSDHTLFNIIGEAKQNYNKEEITTAQNILKKRIKEKMGETDTIFIAKALFWIIVFAAFMNVQDAFNFNSYRTFAFKAGLNIYPPPLLEFFYSIALFGIIPVIIFVVYSKIRLSKKQ